jgi:transposase InsO family protein
MRLLEEPGFKDCRKSRICKSLGISLRTLENWKKKGIKDKRKGSAKTIGNKLSDLEEEKIITTCCNDRFKDLTPYEIVPILAEEGRYLASESTVYRVLKKAGLLKHRSNLRRSKQRKKEIIEVKAEGINQIWSWDITYLKTNVRGKYLYLYLVMDIWSRTIMGFEIHEVESGDLSSAMMRKLCKKHGIKKKVLLLHSDNGGPMKNKTMFATLQRLGVTCSFSRPNVSNDNAFSESLFKTLKYTAGYPKCFENVTDAACWMTKFEKWYNTVHRHSGIGYVTPMQRHKGEDSLILDKRKNVYEEAKGKNPSRWSSNCKRWERINEVYLKRGNDKKQIA